MSTTLLEMCQRVADALEVRVPGVLTASAAGSVTAGNYPFVTSRANASNRRYEGNELYITSGAAAPNPTSIAAYTAASGLFDVSPDYTVTPSATASFDIYLRGVTHAMLVASVNSALRQMRYQTIFPVTLVEDGDMEAAGTAAWTLVSGSMLKVATGPTGLLRGGQSLQVQAAGANGRVRSTSIFVDPTYGGSWYAQAKVRAQTGTARFSAYNVTAGTLIASVDWTNQGWGTVELPFTLPAGCESLAFELGGVNIADLSYWDDVIAYDTGATDVPLPAWITDQNQVRAVHRTLTGQHRYNEVYPWPVRIWDVVPDERNPEHPFRLMTYTSSSGPLWIEASRAFAPLTADADTTLCDPDWLELAAQVELLQRLVRRAAGQEVFGWREMLYGTSPGDRGRLHDLKMVNGRKMPASVIRTSP